MAISGKRDKDEAEREDDAVSKLLQKLERRSFDLLKRQMKEKGRPTYSLSEPHPTGCGFSGAYAAELSKLEEIGAPGDVVFFGVDVELSRKYGGSNAGAATFVRDNTIRMMPWTQDYGAPCRDIGILTTGDPETAMEAVLVMSKYLTRIGRRPALVGCDHAASFAGALGAAFGSPSSPVYLYFDAHLDLGLHRDSTDVLHNGNFVSYLLRSDRIEEIINIGGRSWSVFSPAYKDIPGYTCVRGGVPRTSARQIIERLSGIKGKPLYVSIDADALDPSFAPNVALPEPFGMSADELFVICEWIGANCDVVGCDLCELVPSDRSFGSEQALMRCLHALFPRGKGV